MCLDVGPFLWSDLDGDLRTRAHGGLSRGAIQKTKDVGRLQKLKGERVDKARTETLMFRLARGTRCPVT